jgi:hypothetical protein
VVADRPRIDAALDVPTRADRRSFCRPLGWAQSTLAKSGGARIATARRTAFVGDQESLDQRVSARGAGLTPEHRQLVAEHHDFQLLELLGTKTQRRKLQKASEHDVAERPEHRRGKSSPGLDSHSWLTSRSSSSKTVTSTSSECAHHQVGKIKICRT